MLDVKMMRRNFDEIGAKLQTHGVKEEILVEFLRLDENHRGLLVKVEGMKKYRNDVSAKIARLKRNKEDVTIKIARMKEVGGNIKTLDAETNAIDGELRGITTTLPNLPDASMPAGAGEEENVEVRRWSEPRTFVFEPEPRWEVAENLGTLDLERGAKVVGSRFVYYKGLGIRLERTLYSFMLDLHVYKYGYTEMITPYIVNDATIFGTGQFLKFKEGVLQLQNTDLTLIPTTEVPLVNCYSDEILDGKDLSIYFTILSSSFRSGVDSAGYDTRGLTRLHQFNKVEMVKLNDAEHPYEELEKVTNNTEGTLQKLGLSYRIVVPSTGSMGFSATKTYDLEVWIPVQETYREISSCSNCEDFQARCAMTRYRDESDKVQYVHILNGSGLAVRRTIATILENYQNEDGSVTVPEVLVPCMGNLTVIK